MSIVPADALLERFESLPAAAPLRAALGAAETLYLVGGATRDLLLGGHPAELDLVVDGDLRALVGRLGRPIRDHERFGTCTVVLDGFRYDFARARRETYTAPGALPAVRRAGIDDDLRRRDFTVNAMALALGGPAAGGLRTVDSALEDLRARRLRILHDRSFLDDPLRLLRLARYAARLRFEIEPRTRELARRAVAGGALGTVSGPRIGAELRLLLGESGSVAALGELGELGVDAALSCGFGLVGPEPARRALELLPPEGDRGALVMAVAAGRLDAARLAALLQRLAFPAAWRDTVLAAAGGAGPLAAALQDARHPSEVAAAVAGARAETVALAGALGPAAAAREWLDRLRGVKLEIDGRDLLEAGVAAGPAVGEGLRAALAARLDGGADDREAQLVVALRAVAASR